MNLFWSALLGCVLLLLLSPLAQAGDGYDHDAPLAPATATALPRLAVTGQQFELVGELAPTQLRIYIDWLTTTAPAAGAELQVQLNDQRLSIEETSPGTFVAHLPANWAKADGDKRASGQDHDYPQELPLVVTIALEQAHEQLQGHFDLPADGLAEPKRAGYGRWLAATLLIAGLALLGWRRRGHGGRR
ncbi:MAG: hypothetical protein II007_02425 [Gammaproteobacteria bacterium]|nr:hypothetical protein [Gammaproteobacteria bacterium]